MHEAGNLKPVSALGQPRGIEWGGRWAQDEGTHVYPWSIHVVLLKTITIL